MQIRLTKLPVPVKAPRIGRNLVDPGSTGVRQYSNVERGVQATEVVDSTISNVGAAAGAAMRSAATVGRLAPSVARAAQTLNIAKAVPVLNAARIAGSRLAPVQATLWGVDAGRAVLDPRYRNETLASTNALIDDPSKGTTRKSFEVAANTFARPVSTTGAMMRSYGDSTNRISAAEQEIAQSDKKLDTLQTARREKKWAQGADTARSYIQQVGREAGIQRKFDEPVAPREDYTGGVQRVFPTRHPMVNAYPTTTPDPDTDKWFKANAGTKENPGTTGMAMGGGLNGSPKDEPRTVMLNPYSNYLTKEGRQAVETNERLRHFMDETGYDPKIEPTQAQIDFFKGTEYGKPENRKYLGQTIAARILTGDESAGDVTPAQQAAAMRLQQEFNNTRSNVKMAGVNMDGMERVIPTMVDGKQLTVKEAAAIAHKNGLDKYPSFKTVEEANAFAEKNHGSINEDGTLKKDKPLFPTSIREIRRSPLLKR